MFSVELRQGNLDFLRVEKYLRTDYSTRVAAENSGQERMNPQIIKYAYSRSKTLFPIESSRCGGRKKTYFPIENV